MAFLRNTWYVAAYPEDIGRALFSRRIIGEHLVFFRKESGEPAALKDMCPHRFAPLSDGRLEGDCIECPYHGLKFDAAGRCVFNPHAPGTIPAKMAVHGYPVAERHGLVWIWMGDAARADAARIPDLSYLIDRARWSTVHSYFNLPFAADLMVDNLMDLSHVEYVHKGSISPGPRDDMPATMTTEEKDDTVRVSWVVRNFVPTAHTRSMRDEGPRTDSYRDTFWQPPGIMRNELIQVKTGRPRDEGMLRYNTHCITPETGTSLHDFALRSRNFKLDDREMDARMLEGQRPVVVDEDGTLLSKIQERMGDAPFESLDPVMFNIDGGAVRVRRIMERLIRAEQQVAAEPLRAVQR